MIDKYVIVYYPCYLQCKLLLYIDVDARDEEDLTPLHYAARYKREKTRRSEIHTDVSNMEL